MTQPSARRLAAVMFTDIAGYTALMQQDEESALAVRTHHREALETAVAPHGGKILQFLGDGSLTVFSSVVEAAKAAIEIQRLLALPPVVPLRIGIHHGDIADDAQGIYGDSVNLAARLQSLAPPGAILVSGNAHDEIKNQKALPAVFLGEFTLKNVTHAVPVYAIAAPGLHVPSATEMRTAAVSAGARAATPAHSADQHESGSALLERVRAALSADFEIERELSAGGMGVVFLARDPTLQRHVAIKVMRPELATARAVARFLREARILARIRHPNIVHVHRAGDADGLAFYVMDYLAGDTLADRMRSGPLPPTEARRLAGSLLDALAAAHGAGVIHRDIKPANIFMSGGTTVLVDFGVARAEGTTSERTTIERNVGTPGYMPPEQAAGEEVTEQTDLYAVGMVLYEALTGRRWSILEDSDKADWAAVPPDWREPLRRALAWSPAARWSSAVAFREALSGAPVNRVRRLRVRRALVVIVIAGIVAIAYFASSWPPPRAIDLVIFPFESPGDMGAQGADLARDVAQQLEDIPGFTILPFAEASDWWRRRGRDRFSPVTAVRQLHARNYARGSLDSRGDSLRLRLYLSDTTGSRGPPTVLVDRSSDRQRLVMRAAVALLPTDPRLARWTDNYLSSDEIAAFEFLLGARESLRNQWEKARTHFDTAWARDSKFAAALWWSIIARKWLPLQTVVPYDPTRDLDRLAAIEHGLSKRDQLLLQADRAAAPAERLRLFKAAVDSFRDDEYAYLLYGNELFHRGALAGHSSEEAAEAFQIAVDLQQYLAPAYAALVWIHVREGRERLARAEFERLESASTSVEDNALFAQAIRERFDTTSSRSGLDSIFGGDSNESLQRLRVTRIGLAFELPRTQIALGEYLIRHRRASADDVLSGHLAIALAYFATGRWAEGLLEFDAAMDGQNNAELELQWAEWRVLPAALGLVAVSSTERAAGRRKLVQLSTRDASAMRAAWALALDAYATRDSAAFSRWRDQLSKRVDALAGRSDRVVASAALDRAATALVSMLAAVFDAMQKDYRSALDQSAWIATLDVRTGHADPFARAAYHTLRAEWFEQLAQPDSAEREWRWAGNVDLWGWVTGPPQAAEVDWVMSPYASLRRAQLAFSANDTMSACRQIRRVLDWWSTPDPALRPRYEEADVHRKVCATSPALGRRPSARAR